MKKIFLRLALIFLVITLLTSIIIVGMIFYAGKNVDYELDEALFEMAGEEETTYYYAYDGGDLKEVWKTFGKEKREWVALEEVNQHLISGFISVEDRDFYSHKGINLKRTIAAALNHIFRFRNTFGASTITQQVVKNISGDNETTVKRKINEIFRAIHLEKMHSKDEILEMYLNIIPMSDGIYGVSMAAETYFGKEAQELSIAEAATIIGITNAPSKYNPYTNPEICLEKRNRVLVAMLQNNAIDDKSYEIAVNSPLGIEQSGRSRGSSSWFIETATDDIINDIKESYGVTAPVAKMMLKGSKVILTMSPKIQKILENYFYDTSNLSEKIQDGMAYAMVISDPYTGNLLGIVGNGGKKTGERLLNHATIPITPGSTIKPLSIYAPLLDSEIINWSTIVEDQPIRYINQNGEEIPYPKNAPDVYEGKITINEAIKKSKNTIAVKLLNEFGIDNAFKLLRDGFGFENLVEKETRSDGRILTDIAEAPLALGQLTKGESLRKLTESYNVFPCGGILKQGSSYYSVYDKKGLEIIKSKHASSTLMSKDTADIMNQLLMNVVNDGTARQINLKNSIDTAGKTGTSGGDKDRLFIGYTPYYTAGIWCGYSSGNGTVGANSPSHLQIWDRVMTEIHEELVFDKFDENVKSFDTSGLVVQPYCSKSGNMVGELCEFDDDVRIEYGYYSNANLPNKICDVHE